MPEVRPQFDAEGFFKALEATTKARGLRWKDVSAETGVSASTLSRMSLGRGPDSGSLATLAAWSSLNPADFVMLDKKPAQPEPLAQVTRLLRRDPRLTREAADALDEMIKATYERLATRKA